MGRVDGERIAGIDLARALAIIGMFTVHVGPTDRWDTVGRLYALAYGRASILFVVVAGVGVSLLARRSGRSRAEVRWRLLWRSVLLLPAGLALQELDHGILVILHEYALLFVLGAVALNLSARALVAVALCFALFGPLGFFAGQVVAPVLFNRGPVSWSDSLADIAHGLVLSGPYPLITWAAPFLAGMALGHVDLTRRSVRLYLLFGGLALAWVSSAVSKAVVGPEFPSAFSPGLERLATDAPHSQMPLWLAGSTGSALMVLGLSLMVADAAGSLAWPLVAMGQLALTVYVAHLLALHWWGASLRSDDIGIAAAVVAIMTVVSAVFAVAWRAFWPQGPLEMVLRAPLKWRGKLPQGEG